MRTLLVTASILSIVFSMFTFFPLRASAGTDNVIFQDNFESYAVGSFPSSGGWQLIYNGAGDQYQVITSDYSVSGTKSLQMMGQYSWSAVVEKDFSSSSNLIGYEACLMGEPGSWPSVEFSNRDIQMWGRNYGGVSVNTIDGYIQAGSQNLQPCTPDTWYKIRVVMNRNARTFNVWINDQLKGDNIPEANNPWEIESLRFDVGWHNIKNYYDDAKVFEAVDQSLWIEDIQPVQTLVNPSILIPGKPTVFNMTLVSTYPNAKTGVYMLITCGAQSWYEGPFTVPGNTKIPFCTGGTYYINGFSFAGQCYYPSGEFDVTIKVDAFGANPSTLTKHIGSQTGYQFKDLGKLKILYVPVGFWGGSTAWLFGDPQISDINMQNEHRFSDSFVKTIFPVDPRFFTSAVGQKVELNTPASIIPGLRQYYAWIEFLRKDTELKLWEQPSMGGYYRIVAVVPHGQSPSWLGYWLGTDARGMTYFNTYDSVCWTEEGYWATPAHELWHSYTHVSDSAPVDPWHCSKEGGGYWDQQHACVMYSNQPLMRPCLMHGGDNYQQSLFNDGRTMDLYQWICQDCYAKLRSLSGFQICSDPEVLFASGLVFENDSVSLQPFYHLSDGYADLAPGSVGNYSIRFLDVNQQVIVSYGFNMTFYDNLNVTAFSHAVEYPAGASIVQLLHGDNVIASRDIDASSPSVSLTYPNNGETLVSGENTTIQWQASDPENNTLSFTLLYSSDNGSSWIPIQMGITDTSLNWTVPNDNPSDQCLVKVVATDGVNTAEAISNITFSILRHDIALDGVEKSKSIVGAGYALPVNVTVSNYGNYSEAPTIGLVSNSTTISSQVVNISNGSSMTISISCNTTGFAYGNYTISAYAWPVPGETNTVNNNFAGGTVYVGIPGDLNGDGIVDIYDAILLAGHFNQSPTNLLWNANVDINGDNIVDLYDALILANHYNQHYP